MADVAKVEDALRELAEPARAVGETCREEISVAVVVPAQRVWRAQEIDLAIGHIVCRYVEESLFG